MLSRHRAVDLWGQSTSVETPVCYQLSYLYFTVTHQYDYRQVSNTKRTLVGN